MAAPTVVYIESSTAGGIATLPSSTISTPAVGDLCVCVTNGTQFATTAGGVFYHPDGEHSGDAGYTSIGLANSGATDGKVQIYAKILVSGDFSGGNFLPLDIGHATAWTVQRNQIYIFRHANGWEAVNTQTAYTDIAGFTANVDQSVTASSTRPNVAVLGWANATAVNTLTVKWGSATAAAPYCDELSSTTTTGGHTNHYGTGDGRAQSDYLEYDTGTGPTTFQLNAGASSNHAVVIGFFQTAQVAISGTGTLGGGGTLTATGIPTVNGTAAFSSTATLSGSGVPTVNGVAALSGAGTLHGDQLGAVMGTGTLAGGGTLAGRQAIIGTAVLTGLVTLTATGISERPGIGVLTGGGLLRATGIVGEIPQASAGSWHSGAAYLANQTWADATGLLAGGGALAGSGHQVSVLFGVAALTGTGTLAATSLVTVNGVGLLDGGGVLHGDGFFLTGHRATLDQDTQATLNQQTNATLSGV